MGSMPGVGGGGGKEASRTLRIGADLSCFLFVQGPRGERGPRGITGKPGPKVCVQYPLWPRDGPKFLMHRNVKHLRVPHGLSHLKK